jgi:hypothetical protein
MGFLSSLFGVGGEKRPATTTSTVQTKIPTELSPFVKEVLGEAQALYKADIERGYDPYTGQMIAPLTAEEQRAMEGISGLVGTIKPYIEEAEGVYRTGAEKFTPEAAQEYMSPYQRAVTDIEKREAGRQFDVAQQGRDAAAVGAGGESFMGSRAAILEAEAQRNQQQLLADIEARGLQKAYQDSQRLFSDQKARERQMAGDLARTGSGLFQAGLTEAGAEQRVGEQKRELVQASLDEAYKKFLEERDFPKQTLAEYQGSIYGNPLLSSPSKTITASANPYQPSMGQNLLGLGLTGLNMFGMGGGFGGNFSGQTLGKSLGFPMGKGKTGGGIASLPVVKKQAGSGISSDMANIIAQARLEGPDDRRNYDPEQTEISQERIFPESPMTLEKFQQMNPSLDPTKVKELLTQQASRKKELATKQLGELKALRDPLIGLLKEKVGSGSGAQRAGVLQGLIANIATNPGGALQGFLKGTPEALKQLGEITKQDAKAETDLAVQIFGIESKDLTAAHKIALQELIDDGTLRKTILELPSKARQGYLDELVKRSTISKNLLGSGKRGQLSSTVDKRIESLVAGKLGLTSKLGDDGTLQLMEGNQLISPKKAEQLANVTSKFLKEYAKERRTKTEPDALNAAFQTIFKESPSDDLPSDEETSDTDNSLNSNLMTNESGNLTAKKKSS